VRVIRPCNGNFCVIVRAEIVSWPQRRSSLRLRQVRTHPRLSSSTELSAVNQRVLLGTLPVQEQAGTL
jgi:hypothetical protein